MCLHAEDKQGGKENVFIRGKREVAPAPRLFKADTSAALLRWVGFSGLQDESRQLVLVPARPEIISLLWFTLAAALIPASASIWVLGLV